VELHVGHVDPPVEGARQVVVDRDLILVVEQRRVEVAELLREVRDGVAPRSDGLQVLPLSVERITSTSDGTKFRKKQSWAE
jgi:hypothetical protein